MNDVVTTLALGPDWMDPMYLLSGSGPFGSFILPGIAAIVYIESGLLFPLLPGDSLLFTAGMLSVQHDPFAHLWTVIPTLMLAAFLGDQTGYWIGRKFGDALSRRPDGKIFKQEYLRQSHEFFEKHGPITVIICRFVPIVRTYAPLVTGMSRMHYRTFITFSAIGSTLWGGGVTLLGAWLGHYDIIRNNIEAIFLLIVFISILPGIYGGARSLIAARRNS
ncbi:DedA family protein [Corynebacterium uberis]|uniref:DedA family protein n=1 Tax=Corynebacterium TaxID=1716 RepID=UPI001D0AEB1B|nr:MULTISPECIES: DedA family protein [Corynebacterium]MCZ9309683.1 DedA family protein [Corynebacterium sp. c6VSa_13]UDL73487.1 DedA family protein [Corynebacterium uberis]UDL75633.1 DedA family protein [Corynebacterium uberis]UDL77846.1 DedA family protein [Corynebacterium uberis]UDL80129.1 DedA family protein [Corynebacterium uberis]